MPTPRNLTPSPPATTPARTTRRDTGHRTPVPEHPFPHPNFVMTKLASTQHPRHQKKKPYDPPQTEAVGLLRVRTTTEDHSTENEHQGRTPQQSTQERQQWPHSVNPTRPSELHHPQHAPTKTPSPNQSGRTPTASPEGPTVENEPTKANSPSRADGRDHHPSKPEAGTRHRSRRTHNHTHTPTVTATVSTADVVHPVTAWQSSRTQADNISPAPRSTHPTPTTPKRDRIQPNGKPTPTPTTPTH